MNYSSTCKRHDRVRDIESMYFSSIADYAVRTKLDVR